MWRVLNWFRAHREGAQVCRFELKPLVVREDSSTVRNRSIAEKAQSPSTYAPAHNASLTAAISRASSSVAVRRATSSPISAPGSKASPDALNGLPSSHGDVPKLGPPLPGDLGRPILERQCRLATEGQVPSADPAAQAAAAERERLLAERKAARESGVLATRSQAPNLAAAVPNATGDAASLRPTIAIRPGSPVRLVVHKDLVLA